MGTIRIRQFLRFRLQDLPLISHTQKMRPDRFTWLTMSASSVARLTPWLPI